jgi:predicted aspartyl protease
MTVGVLARAACLLAFFASPALAADEACRLQRVAALDMHFGDTGSPVVPVTIAGETHNLLVDTGSSYTALNEAKARAMGLRLEPIDAQRIFMFDGTPIRYRTRASNFLLGRVPVPNFTFMVLPDNQLSGTKEDGLLGGDILSRLDVDFDFTNMKLNLFTSDIKCGDSVVYWADAYARLPVEFFDSGVESDGRRNQPTHLMIRPRLDGKEIRTIVDSGASTTVMTMPQARKFFGWSDPPPEVRKVGGAEGRDYYLYTARSLALGPLSFANTPIIIVDQKDTRLDRDFELLLGMDILRELHVLVSYRQKALYLTLNPAKPAAEAKPAP